MGIGRSGLAAVVVLGVAVVGVVFVRIRFETMGTGRSGLAAVVLPIAWPIMMPM